MKFLLNFNKPYYLIFFVTSRCNAKCEFCLNKDRASSIAKENELTFEEIQKISSNYSCLKVLSFTGGEPFLRKDLLEIIEFFLKNTPVEYINLHTNGYNPDKLKQILESVTKLKKHKYFSICLSIDDLYENHDKIRGIAGLYEKNLECISIIKHFIKKDKRFDIMSGLVITKNNYKTFAKTDTYLNNELKINSSVGIERFTDRETELFLLKEYSNYTKNLKLNSKRFPLFSFRNVKQSIENLMPEIVEKNIINNKRDYKCIAGTNLAVLYENGEVKPCELLGKTFGNLREYDYNILNLLNSPNAKKTLQKIKNKECCCFWENPLPFNIIYSPSTYWKIIKNICGDLI